MLRLFCMVLLKTIEHDVISVTFIFRWLCSCKYRSDSNMKESTTNDLYLFHSWIMQGQEGSVPNCGNRLFSLKAEKTFQRLLSVIVCVNCDLQQPCNPREGEEVTKTQVKIPVTSSINLTCSSSTNIVRRSDGGAALEFLISGRVLQGVSQLVSSCKQDDHDAKLGINAPKSCCRS